MGAPLVRVSAPASATAGQPVVVRDAGSTVSGGVWVRGCRQIFGPGVNAGLEFLADGSCKVTPPADTPQNSKLVIAYEVMDNQGQSGVALAELRVTGGPAASSTQSPPPSRAALPAAWKAAAR